MVATWGCGSDPGKWRTSAVDQTAPCFIPSKDLFAFFSPFTVAAKRRARKEVTKILFLLPFWLFFACVYVVAITNDEYTTLRTAALEQHCGQHVQQKYYFTDRKNKTDACDGKQNDGDYIDFLDFLEANSKRNGREAYKKWRNGRRETLNIEIGLGESTAESQLSQRAKGGCLQTRLFFCCFSLLFLLPLLLLAALCLILSFSFSLSLHSPLRFLAVRCKHAHAACSQSADKMSWPNVAGLLAGRIVVVVVVHAGMVKEARQRIQLFLDSYVALSRIDLLSLCMSLTRYISNHHSIFLFDSYRFSPWPTATHSTQ